MGRPKKYPDDNPYAAQKAYLKSPKGKTARKKYESSDRSKKRKLDWWHQNKSPKRIDHKQYFIDTYGDPVVALELLNQKEKFVIKHLYGLDGGPPLTQKAIASMMDCSHQWVSLLKKQAEKKLASLKKVIENHPPPKK